MGGWCPCRKAIRSGAESRNGTRGWTFRTSFIASEVQPGEDLVILELGVGPGHQLECLLGDAVAWPVKSLRVIGVDLCPAYLAEAAGRVERAAEGLSFPVTFHGVAASFTNLEHADLRWKPQIVASTLALHHLPWRQKTEFFRVVPHWGAHGFFIGEVDGMLDQRPGEPDARPEAGRELYQSVFRAVSEQAGLGPTVAASVNRFFFEPELRRIVANPYEERGEYYVPGADWEHFLAESGFGRTEVRETFAAADGRYRLVAVTGRRETREGVGSS